MDDLDARFTELVSQIDPDEQRKMRQAAIKGVRQAGEAPPRKIHRGWLATAGVVAVLAAAGSVLAFRPDLVSPAPAVRQSEPSSPEPTPVGPFAGSPAEGYATGAAGFVMPEAKAIGGLSKKEVAKGLERVRDMLVAATLDAKTLLGGKPTAFTRLLDPEQRKESFGATRFAPKTAELATDVIKVHGAAKLSTFRRWGRTGVRVKINYLVVYAIQRPGRPDQVIRLVTHPEGAFAIFRESGQIRIWAEGLGASATPASCDRKDGFIHPVYPDSGPGTVTPSGAPQDPYDLTEESPGRGCGTSQGT